MSQSSFERIVVKVGSSVLTDAAGKPSSARLTRLVGQLAECVDRGYEVVLVSSGAIACGMGQLGLARRPKNIAQLQACAAIGQSVLMQRYGQAFGGHRMVVAQVLLTQSDLSDRPRYRNATNTLRTLLKRRIVPIINENDAVSVEEITFGDNDRLAALVACAVGAQLLVVLSDVDGVLEHGKPIGRIDELNSHHQAIALGASKEISTGGMASKLAAARIVRHAGIPMVIANGTKAGVLLDIMEGKPVGTLIAPPSTRLKSHKWWIAFAMRRASGAVRIGSGAAQTLHGGRGLLASGIREVRGRFHAGDPVAILDGRGREVARGVSKFSSDALKGLLGARPQAEVVPRNKLVLTAEWQ